MGMCLPRRSVCAKAGPVDDERTDRAVDEVARQMTAGEPGPDFTARVVARMESGFEVRHSWFGVRGSAVRRAHGALSPSKGGFGVRVWRPAVAGLSVAALLVMIVLISRDRDPSHAPNRLSQPVAEVPTAQAEPIVSSGPQEPAGPNVGAKPDAAYRASLTPHAAGENEIAALAPPSLDMP